tara:strand:+ start:298 stop:825 length:528 start_codon:yes stop_codon:yes gene_type:complete
MNQKEKDIIIKYAMDEISKSELSLSLPQYSGDKNIISRYAEAIQEKNADNIIYLAMLPKQNLNSLIEVERKLLLQNWHNTHEDIAQLFQKKFNNNKVNIDYLLKAIKNIPEYLKHDNLKYQYIRQLIYAIGAQPEPDSINALATLTKSEDEKIRNLAAHQIEKRKQYGRWEVKNI